MHTLPFKRKTLVAFMGGLSLALAGSLSAQAAVKPPTAEEMWAVIQAQAKVIEELKAKQQATEQKVETTDKKVEATSQSVEKAAQAVEEAAVKSASASSWADRTTVGGYGELHYNNLENDTNDDEFNEIDFHRFVLFFGHEFNDDIRFFSEVEIEHTGVEADGDPLGGELELEQAYIDFDINDNHTARAGLFLVPVGILNETHEPNTFFGVERNQVESRIIPSTWWNGGVGLHGQFGNGFSYDLGLTSGLATPTTGSNAYRIRNGRQKVSEAVANDPAYTARLKYTGVPGLELAATVHYEEDLTQGLGTVSELDSSATLFETHLVWQRGGFGLRALYATWDLDGAPGSAVAVGGATAANLAGRDEQTGWYVEPSYKFNSKWGIFARYSEFDNRAGSNAPSDSEITQTDFGVNYWPHEDVVLKADIQSQSGGTGDGFTARDGFNLGVGYQF
jgi:hypothetical protein